MLHSFFGSNRPSVLILLMLPVLLLVILTGIYVEIPINEFGGPIYRWVFDSLLMHKWALLTLGAAINMGTAYLLNSIINAHNFNQKENFFPALVFVFISSIDLSWWYLNPISIGTLFLLLSLRRLLRVYRIQAVTGKVFDAGVFMALAVLAFPPFICAVPLIWFSILQLRTFNLREWLVPVSGFLLPFIYLAAYFWYTKSDFALDRFDLTVSQELPQFQVLMPAYFYGLLSLTFIISFIGASIFTGDMRVSTVHKKNSKKVVVWLVFVLILTVLYCYKIGAPVFAFVWLLAIPASISCGDFFISTKRKPFVVTLFYIWIIAIALYPLFTLFI